MTLLRGGLVTVLSVAALAVSSRQGMAATPSAANPDGTPQLLTELTFNGTTPMATSVLSLPAAGISNLSPPGWTFGTVKGASLGVETTASPTVTGGTVSALEGSYPVPGAGSQFINVSYNLESLQTEDVYIEFWAKMPGAKGGCKFLKIFGDASATAGFANMTFGPNYSGGDYGSFYLITFGDGTGLLNDGQHGIYLNGQHPPQTIGRSFGTATVLTPQDSAFTSADWGTAWHHFRIHAKFNSGTTMQNEVPDGEVYFEIDGKVYADATGLYDRNPANGPIHNIGFFGWAQHDPEAFQIWFYDIRISTGGFLSQPLPDPPANVAASMPDGG